ncbi:MAG: alpha-glucosidase [Spirochaetota bacterium]
MKIVLIGAGSAQFGYDMLEDIAQSRVLTGAEISLLDIREQAVMEVKQQAEQFIDKHGLSLTVTAGTDRPEALKNADFVVISIEVGERFELWEQDWRLPQQYGIHQVYGENGGAGGVFHALRIIPPILEIAADIMTYCPQAKTFCYSNPMTPITMAVKQRFPELQFFGMCHEIASLKRYLPEILGIPLERIHFRAGGLNHFSVLLEASDKHTGEDLLKTIMEKAYHFFSQEPGYSDVLAYYRKTGVSLKTEGAAQRFAAEVPKSSKPWADRRMFKHIMDHFGLLPITWDSHIGEYVPWAYDGADHQGILDFYTFYRYTLAQLAPELVMRTDGYHERAVPMMEAFIEDSGHEEAAVNILNDGLIPQLPPWLAVEVPARVYKDRLEPIAFPNFPRGFAALLRNYAGTYDLTVQAVLQQRKDLVVQALLVNPVIDKVERIPELVEVMIERQHAYLKYLK